MLLIGGDFVREHIELELNTAFVRDPYERLLGDDRGASRVCEYGVRPEEPQTFFMQKSVPSGGAF